MSDVQLYLLEVDSNKLEASSIAGNTAKKLEMKDVKLVDVIQSLGEYLNNEDGAIRTKTMAYLSEVLTAMPSKVLSRQQRDLLNDFILSRIANGAEGLGHCARGLLALEKLALFEQERTIKIINSLLQYTSPLTQVKQQSERFAVLTLLDILLANHRKVLQHLHDTEKTFLSRFVSYLEGEKDPRNLMVVFSILNVPMVEWDVSANAQELFDAVFNYFPITFRPPPGDPYGITAQQLKDRLRECIASTSLFGPHAFPALLDKLDSTSINVKRDALQAITSCVSRYGLSTVSLYSITLWDALKFEILNVQEEDLAEEALNALQEITRQLSNGPHDTQLHSFLKPITKECNEHLEDAPTKQPAAAGRILSAVAKASPQASNIVVRAVVPQILALNESADSLPRRRNFLEILDQLILSSIFVFGRWRTIDIDNSSQSPQAFLKIQDRSSTLNCLTEFTEQCVQVFTTALTSSPGSEVSFRLLALESLRNLVLVRNLLDDDSIARTIRLVYEIVINESSYGKDEVKAGAIDALVEIAHQKPQLIIESAIPAFMARLPDCPQPGQTNHVSILEAFAKLSAEKQIFSTIIVRLKNKLYAALRGGASPVYMLSIFSALLYSFTHGAVDLKDPTTFGSYYQDIVVPFLKDTCSLNNASSHSSNIIFDESILDIIGRICNIIIRPQDWVAQTEICRNTYTCFRAVGIENVPPFRASGNFDAMIVSTHLLAALQREARPHTDMSALLNSIIKFAAIDTLPASVRNATIAQISLVVNKFIPAATTTDLINTLLQGPDSVLAPSNLTPTSLRIAFAILKALLLRTDPNLSLILPTYLSLLSDPTHGPLGAHLFSTLLAPDDLLTKENHCIIYALHKQRFFSIVGPSLATSFRTGTADPQTTTNTLTALSGILQHTPYALLRGSLPLLTAPLLRSLSAGSPAVKAASVSTFARVLLQDPAAVEEHVGSLVERLLDIATNSSCSNKPSPPLPSTTRRVGKAADTIATTGTAATTLTQPPPPNPNPAKLRAASLACLASFVACFRAELLLPWKRVVVRRLAEGPLDDGRRAVRAEAVRARVAWEGLGEAEGGD